MQNKKHSLIPFFNHSPDYLCIANPEGYFLKINPAFIKLMGYTEGELLSRPIIDFVYPEDRERTSESRTNLKLDAPLINFENRYVNRDGKIAWLQWTSILMENERKIYGIAKNVTQRKNLEAERNAFFETLTKKNLGLKELNYTTSHNLRSPVSNIVQLISLLSDISIGDKEKNEILNMIRVCAIGLNSSLEEYVDAIKEREAVGVKMETINFDAVLDKVENSIGMILESSGATICRNFDEQPDMFYNWNYMESIFLNLITNSIKYAKPSTNPNITISTGKDIHGQYLVYVDNGLGFDLNKVGHLIFQINRTFHNHEDGKGIGLFLVHSHVTTLGGKITLESEPNMGSKFRIDFKNA